MDKNGILYILDNLLDDVYTGEDNYPNWDLYIKSNWESMYENIVKIKEYINEI